MFGNVVVILPCLFIFRQLIWYMVICFWSLRGLFVCFSYIWRENSWELIIILSFFHIGPGRWTRLGGLHPLNHLTSLIPKICLRNSWRHHTFSCNLQCAFARLCRKAPSKDLEVHALWPFLLIRGDWGTFQNLGQVPRHVNHPSYHLEKVCAATSPLSW